jgi:predicted house-cleaning noncanonical NTP pyrophosphatase (MazG superfamily)
MLPKLVRDNIPDMIKKSGKPYSSYEASLKKLDYFLIEKMKEELLEFKDSPCLEEAADMYEVFLAILNHWNFDLKLVKEIAEAKKSINGSFNKGIILEKVGVKIN